MSFHFYVFICSIATSHAKIEWNTSACAQARLVHSIFIPCVPPYRTHLTAVFHKIGRFLLTIYGRISVSEWNCFKPTNVHSKRNILPRWDRGIYYPTLRNALNLRFSLASIHKSPTACLSPGNIVFVPVALTFLPQVEKMSTAEPQTSA